uniref:Uncharacterized protein n=1 Tax=Oryza barthii TaxID=65489 RepID=A0A0D3EN48_9ORYZ
MASEDKFNNLLRRIEEFEWTQVEPFHGCNGYVWSCASTSLVLKELDVGADTTCTTNIDVPDHPKETAMIVFLTTDGEFKVVPTSIEPIVIFLPRAMTDLK